MCGIVGALVFENASFTITESYIRRMRDTMVHRGPDGALGRPELEHLATAPQSLADGAAAVDLLPGHGCDS